MLIPLGTRVLIEVLEEEETSTIIITDKEKKSLTGTVKAIGEGVSDVAVGDTIAYGKFSGIDYEDDLLLEQHEILGILTK